ncbi:MAG TPA: energy transducer TonB, partial [Pyrinomonadaceae bacterium]
YYCPMMSLQNNELLKKINRALLRVEKPEEAIEDDRRWAALNDRETAGAQVEGGVLNGKAMSKPQPHYPPEAKAQRVSGTVTVYIKVDEQGKVIEAEAICGHKLLAGVSVAAARQARFTPTLLSGKPVKVSGVITYNFVLR